MKTRLWLVALLALALLIAACGQAAPTEPAQAPAEPAVAEPAEPAAQSVAGGTVTRALTSEPTSLDPHGPPGSGQNILLPYLFDTLVFRDTENNYLPLLATSWEIEEEGRAITFQLRDDVVFHDGTPLDAAAVVFSFERFRELGARSPVAGGLQDISGIEALDGNRVRFTFATPSAVFFSTISMPYAGIVSPTAVEQLGENFAQQPVGTGPFKLASWDPGLSIVLEPNPDYAWGPPVVANSGAPTVDQAVFKVIPDATTQLAAFQAGEVDIIFLNQPEHLQRLREDPAVQLIETPMNSLAYLGFNCQRAPFDDVRVRQALAAAINKDEIVQLALGGVGSPAFAFMADSLPGFSAELQQYERSYDPAQTATLLTAAGFVQTDAGWERDGQLLQIELLTSTRAPNQAVATIIQSQLQAVGVPLNIQQLDGPSVLKTAGEGSYDVLLWRYDWNDSDVLNIYLGSDRIGQTNRSFYANGDVDALFEQAAHELDQTQRSQYYVDAQEILLEDVPWQPLYAPVDALAISQRVQGFTLGPMARVLLNDAYVTE